ncbi:hypothetical protein GCM10010873_21560 [Cypionkella aquatica]|uniref:Uncharacterized protein n=1 Tax=Cypionkella aquatica TaxID=1756042 RepID=A0AA37X0B7_9RHOB|nr:hypothetical protein [Cypionkella aquatica]GLS87182.1 hypothetical protein GCM10010873_21560 [Cypionkella aquatica]
MSAAEDRKLREEYIAFEKSMRIFMMTVAKRIGWKKNGNCLYLQSGRLFFAAHQVPFRDQQGVLKLKMLASVKPMKLDDLLWDVLDIPEHNRTPVSLRATSSFCCGGLPIAAFVGDIDDVDSLIDFLQSALLQARDLLASQDFSDLCIGVFANPDSHSVYPRGDYLWITYVVALLAEDHFEIAERVLESFDKNRWGLIGSFYQSDLLSTPEGKTPTQYTFSEMVRNYIRVRPSNIPKVGRQRSAYSPKTLF